LIKKYDVILVVTLFVLIVLNSLCFGQATQTGTNRVMIKGQWVDVPVFTIKGPTYYDARPEEAEAQRIYDLLRPPGPSSYEAGVEQFRKEHLMDIMKASPPPSDEAEQGYGRGMDRYYRIPSSPSPPSIPSGAINVRTGDYYPGVAGGVINPKTGDFYPDVGGGYINPSTGEFMPKIGGR